MQSNALRWRNYPIRTKLRVAVLLPMTALLLSCVLIGLVSSQQQDANRWVIHTLQVRLAVASFERQFSAAEARLSKYLDSKTPDAKSAARSALVESQGTLANIQQLTSDNPGQQRRISEVNSLLSRCINFLSASSVNRTAEASLGSQVQSRITEMDQEELRLLSSRTDRTGRLQALLAIVITGTILVGVLGSFFGVALLSNNISRRISQLLESAFLIAEGLNVKSLDPSTDELGRLASALAQTSRVLSERAGEITEVNWKLESVLRAATSVSIIAEDSSGRITLFSAGATKLLGYQAEEAIGRSLPSIVQEQSSGAEDVARMRESKEYETTYLRKDGLPLHVHVSITPLKNIAGKVTGHLYVAHDITPRKLLEAELRRKVDMLRAGEQPATNEEAAGNPELPEWLKSGLHKDASQLSSKLEALNNWYEAEGYIPSRVDKQSSELPYILVVDDFEATRFLLRAYLEGEAYRLDFAANGREALERVAAHHYQLILMDVEMPEMDGYEAATRIREWEKSQGRPPVPIVALTAHDQLDSAKAGVWTAYIQKPVSKTQLLAEVRAHLEAKVA